MSEQSMENGDGASPVSEEHIAFTTQFSDNLEVQANTTLEGTAVPAEHDPFDAFVRLVIGTGLVGVEELGRYLQEWEKTAREEEGQITPDQEDTQAAVIRYAVLGALFEAKDFVEESASQLSQTAENLGHAIAHTAQPVTNSRFFQPIQKQFNTLVKRGEEKLTPLVARGRREDPATRALAREAITQAVDEVIEYLAENEEVTELIQQQSMGMATEVVEDVRTRTVTADTVLEHFTRRLARRRPREKLPPPSPEILAYSERLARQMKQFSEDNQ